MLSEPLVNDMLFLFSCLFRIIGESRFENKKMCLIYPDLTPSLDNKAKMKLCTIIIFINRRRMLNMHQWWPQLIMLKIES